MVYSRDRCYSRKCPSRKKTNVHCTILKKKKKKSEKWEFGMIFRSSQKTEMEIVSLDGDASEAKQQFIACLNTLPQYKRVSAGTCCVL
jgi:hypothetical protein